MTQQTRQNKSIFPDMPRDKKIVDEKGELTANWDLYFQQLTQALQTNYKSEGIVVPPLPDTDITQLVGDASKNNILYDSTNNEFKGNVNGTWKTFTLV